MKKIKFIFVLLFAVQTQASFMPSIGNLVDSDPRALELTQLVALRNLHRCASLVSDENKEANLNLPIPELLNEFSNDTGVFATQTVSEQLYFLNHLTEAEYVTLVKRTLAFYKSEVVNDSELVRKFGQTAKTRNFLVKYGHFLIMIADTLKAKVSDKYPDFHYRWLREELQDVAYKIYSVYIPGENGNGHYAGVYSHVLSLILQHEK